MDSGTTFVWRKKALNNMKNINKQPLVSIVMPVYNAENYLVPAIDSVIKQSYKNIELIIIDDKSTDSSLTIIEQFKKKYPTKIRIVKMHKRLNCGGDMCANEGIKKARGKYIARMDADDISHKDRIKKQVEFLEKHKEVFLVGSNAYVIDQTGKVIGEKKEPTRPFDIYNSYFTFHPLIHPTCMFRRIVNGKPFSYKLEYNANNDYLTFFTLLCKGYIFVNLPQKLLYYRIHGKNDTFKNMKRKFSNTIKIRGRMVLDNNYKPTPKALAINLVQAALIYTLPERITFDLYMASKGIIEKKQVIKNILPKSAFKIQRGIATAKSFAIS